MVDLAERLVDRFARRPGGVLGRLMYRFPLAHKPGFDRTLARLPPRREDHIVEVGCGGGVFMRRALASGCTAIAIDHSADMVATTASLNAQAIREGRLQVREADACSLPIGEASADKLYCLNAFFFFPEPASAIAEMARVLKPGGGLALITATPPMRDKIARFFARMAERMRFDTPEQLRDWACAAGLHAVDTIDIPNTGVLYIARKPEEL